MNRIRHEASISFRSMNDESRSVEGIACVFGQETDLGFFYESIDSKAFDGCDMSDVYLLFNHDSNFPLARTQNGTLKLSVEDGGLRQESTIVSTSQGNDIYQLVKEGLIDKMSFAFTIDRNHGDEWWTDDDGGEHRLIKKIDKLFDVSLVTYPAYGQTSAHARSLDDLDEIAKEHIQERNSKMNEEIREEVAEEVAEETVEEVAETVEEAPVEVAEERKEERTMNTNFEMEQREVAYNSTPEYRSAWIKAIIGKGDAELNAIKEARGLSTASATLVPTYIADRIEKTWEANKLLNEVSIVYSTAKLSFPVESANSGAGFHVEGAEAPAEEEITLIDKLLQPMTAKKWISVTDELIASGEVAIMDYIAEEVSYYILRAINNAIVAGSLASGKGIEGIVNSSLANAVSAGALDATTLYKGLATLIDVNNPVALMNPNDFYTKVMGLKDSTDRPIFSAIGEEKFVNGCRVLLQSAVPANKVIVGDLSAFKLELEAREPRIVFDPYTSAKEDKVNVVGKLMAAGALTKKNKVAVVTFTA